MKEQLTKMECLECGGKVEVPQDALEGELVTCPDCGVSFEVFRAGGGDLQIRPAQVEGEDWGE